MNVIDRLAFIDTGSCAVSNLYSYRQLHRKLMETSMIWFLLNDVVMDLCVD